MQHLMHISLQHGFDFVVHPSAFVVHVPHKKPSTKWLTRKMGQVGGGAGAGGAGAWLVGLVGPVGWLAGQSMFSMQMSPQRPSCLTTSPPFVAVLLPLPPLLLLDPVVLPQKEKNHILFDNALFHMRQMDFVPVTAFPQLCTKEVRRGVGTCVGGMRRADRKAVAAQQARSVRALGCCRYVC